MLYERVIIILIVFLQLVIKNVTNFSQNSEVLTPQMITNDINQFSLNLYKKIIEAENGNIILSPFNVWISLSLLTLGSDKNTNFQLESVLHHRKSNVYYDVVQQIIRNLNTANQFFITDNLEIQLSNKIFVKNLLKIQRRFHFLGISIYGSNTQFIDFNNNMTCYIINQWIAQNTRGAIREILQPGNFKQDTSLLLLSTLYVKGRWLYQFVPFGTKKRMFYLEDGTSKETLMMYSRNNFKHINVDNFGFTIIELPYRSVKSTSMFIILPNEHKNLHAVEMSLLNVDLQKLMITTKPQDTALYLPKFTIESEINLEMPLRKLGIRDIFENYADFTNLSNESLHVSNFIQKIVIEATESGTMTGAVSEGQLETRMTPAKVINVDRPFLVFIYCEGVLLISGRVVNPTYEPKNITVFSKKP